MPSFSPNGRTMKARIVLPPLQPAFGVNVPHARRGVNRLGGLSQSKDMPENENPSSPREPCGSTMPRSAELSHRINHARVASTLTAVGAAVPDSDARFLGRLMKASWVTGRGTYPDAQTCPWRWAARQCTRSHEDEA